MRASLLCLLLLAAALCASCERRVIPYAAVMEAAEACRRARGVFTERLNPDGTVNSVRCIVTTAP